MSRASDDELLRALRLGARYEGLTLLMKEAAGRWPGWGREQRTALCAVLLRMELFVTERAGPGPHPGDAVRAANAAALYGWAVRPLLGDPELAAEVTRLLPRLFTSPHAAARAAVRRITDAPSPGLPETTWQALLKAARTRRPAPPARSAGPAEPADRTGPHGASAAAACDARGAGWRTAQDGTPRPRAGSSGPAPGAALSRGRVRGADAPGRLRQRPGGRGGPIAGEGSPGTGAFPVDPPPRTGPAAPLDSVPAGPAADALRAGKGRQAPDADPAGAGWGRHGDATEPGPVAAGPAADAVRPWAGRFRRRRGGGGSGVAGRLAGARCRTGRSRFGCRARRGGPGGRGRRGGGRPGVAG
ncbi:hypothetical protein [Streptomyces sp. CC228A]|uniref:hypothetical protein n=1 Tax=Streptomyces sp. CC228A TaxID=2898186 RepID=UPI001F2C160D|nr:hypothetical protein [Streptomyces sp. CC228A]